MYYGWLYAIARCLEASDGSLVVYGAFRSHRMRPAHLIMNRLIHKVLYVVMEARECVCSGLHVRVVKP